MITSSSTWMDMTNACAISAVRQKSCLSQFVTVRGNRWRKFNKKEISELFNYRYQRKAVFMGKIVKFLVNTAFFKCSKVCKSIQKCGHNSGTVSQICHSPEELVILFVVV